MKFRLLRSTLPILTLLVTCSCGSNSSSSSSSGNIKLSFASSTLSTTGIYLPRSGGGLNALVTAGANCSVTVESTTTNGKCYTPMKISGFFNKVSLANTGGGAPVRILGGGNRYSGFQDVFRHEPFDFSSSVKLDGDDNIQDGTASSYSLLTLDMQSIEYKFAAVVGGVTKYYTVRNFFTDSTPSGSTTLTACGLSSGELSEADTYGTLYSGIVAKRGDIMVCIKTSASDTCSNSDFVWLDGVGNTYTTRPVSPLALAGAQLTHTPACTPGSRPEITWGRASIGVSVPTPISISARNSSGTRTYTSGSNSGTQLTVAIDIAVTESLLIPNAETAVLDLTSVANEATLLGKLNKILLKPIFKNNTRSSASDSGDSLLSGNVTLTIQ